MNKFKTKSAQAWKKINIAELLKDCPTGMELDCLMYDNLYFDKVDEDWLPCFFGGICNKDSNYPYRTVGGERWKCCIPYEGNEHLLNKTADCSEYYKNW